MASKLLYRLLSKTAMLRMIAFCCLTMPYLAFSFSLESVKRQHETLDKQELPSLSSVFATSHNYRHPVADTVKRSEPTKPASCKCTCETKAVVVNSSESGEPLPANQHSSYEYLRGRRSVSTDQYSTHRKRTMPATCTCTCETKPISDEETPSSAIANHPSGIVDTADEDPLNWQDQFNDDWINSLHASQEDLTQQDEPMSAALESNIPDNNVQEPAEQYPETWGHASRFPWKRLPDVICYREQCRSDADCCFRYNICDRSAKVCVDCWYGAACTSERDCCHKYPHCQRATYRANSQGAGTKDVTVGKCVDTM